MNHNLLSLLGIGASAAILPFAACSPDKKDRADDKPNVIIILADDIGFGDLSFNGETTISTPQVDKIAASGIRFTDAHSVAATSTPSRYSLLTGRYAWRKQGTGVAAGNAGMIVRPEEYTLADLFQDNGYATAAVGKWHLGLGDKTGTQDWNGHITPGLTDIGFQYSYIMAATADRVPCVFVENERIVNLDPNDRIEVSYEKPFAGEPTGRANPEMLTMQLSNGHDHTLINGISRIGYMKGGKQALWTDENIADSITSHAVSFIEQNKEKPFFLYFGTNDIHVPRVPHPRFAGKSGMGVRGDAILEFDWSVGQIMAALEKHGLTENTIVVITSDNGPVVDDGYADGAVESLGSHRPWGDFRGGKYSVFEAGTRVPLVVSWPKKIEAKVSNALVSQLDFFASFAHLIGGVLPENSAPDSQNQIDVLMGNSTEGRAHIIEQGWSLGVYDGTWKYIEASNADAYDRWTDIELGNAKVPQLYNLKEDINEQNDLSAKYPERVAELRTILNEEIAKGRE